MNNGTSTHSNPLLSYDLSYPYNVIEILILVNGFEFTAPISGISNL